MNTNVHVMAAPDAEQMAAPRTIYFSMSANMDHLIKALSAPVGGGKKGRSAIRRSKLAAAISAVVFERIEPKQLVTIYDLAAAIDLDERGVWVMRGLLDAANNPVGRANTKMARDAFAQAQAGLTAVQSAKASAILLRASTWESECAKRRAVQAGNGQAVPSNPSADQFADAKAAKVERAGRREADRAESEHKAAGLAAAAIAALESDQKRLLEDAEGQLSNANVSLEAFRELAARHFTLFGKHLTIPGAVKAFRLPKDAAGRLKVEYAEHKASASKLAFADRERRQAERAAALASAQIAKQQRLQRPARPQTLTASAISKRPGWSPSAIVKFLGVEDFERPNPRYRSGSPMRLWLESKVIAVEASPDFVASMAKTEARKQAGKLSAETKRNQLFAEISKLDVRVRKISLRALLGNAIRHYNEFKEQTSWSRGGDFMPATTNSDPAFLERIQVNYIRHQLTDYDTELEEIAGRTGVGEGVARIRGRVFDAIGASYPEFRDECGRQRYGSQ